MINSGLQKELLEAQSYLTNQRTDFTATYMTLANVQFIIGHHIEIIDQNIVTALLSVLTGKEHTSQRQVFFLYKKAANALRKLIKTTADADLARHAKNALIHILQTTKGKPYRAAAEALGSVPLDVKGPCLPNNEPTEVPAISWQALVQSTGFQHSHSAEFKGRNIILKSENTDKVLVVKMAYKNENLTLISSEGFWMDFLTEHKLSFTNDMVQFQIPEPLKFSESYLFCLQDLPVAYNLPPSISARHYAIAYIAPTDYYCYPNEHKDDEKLPEETFYEIITRNAWLLGRLTSRGIVHTAPIPLFHNRVQQERRDDRGLYQWPRGGRLDQWLTSCRFPNIGKTGLRDFEHFTSFSESPRKLYEYIGTHILSLILITGSYFRNMNLDKIGLDKNGNPVDTRKMFDAEFMDKTIRQIFSKYFHGFTGSEFKGKLPIDFVRFIPELIEEMGVDRYMEETLRVAEQHTMTEMDFVQFLADRSYSKEKILQINKGEKDITILTGPHLGGFNQQISIPVLIEFTAAASALCISNRYYQEKFAA